MKSLNRFIKILKSLNHKSYGPDGLWQLNYSHWNNVNFYKGFTFSYWYEGVMPNNLECLKSIREFMIKELEELGQEKFEQGGWLISFEIEDTKNNVDLKVFFQVAGGPGSTPPKQ